MSNKISSICLVFKALIIPALILFIVALIPVISETQILRNNIKGSQVVDEYAVFSKFNVENGAFDNDQNYLDFYQQVSKSNIQYIYVDFREYVGLSKTEEKDYEESERLGEMYRIASVDLHYLKVNKVEVFDEGGKKINLREDRVVYLLPLSKQNWSDKFRVKAKLYNEKINIQEDVEIYYYKDRSFDTFDVLHADYTQESPIIRVVNPNIQISYNQSYRGLDIAGTGMSTALKINISKDGKQDTFKNMKTLLRKSDLEQVLKSEHFVSYDEYLNDQNVRWQKINFIFMSGSLIVLLAYSFVVLQTFVLYIHSHIDKVLVKTLLGHSRLVIFREIFLKNLAISLIPIIGIVSYVWLSKAENAWLVSDICLLFIGIEILILFLIVALVKTDKVYELLKGKEA
ncbi:MAG: hypothetical protein ACK5KR_05325 [Breznakia sp.]